MNPSTSLGTRSNVGMAKPSPPVRQAGNIRRLLVIHGVCRRSLPSACAHVKSRCRCRDTVISRASDEHPVVARPWPGGEKRRGRRASHHQECEALGSFLLPCAATGASLLAVLCLVGATPRGAAVDTCRDTTAWVRRAERAADGGVVDVPRALSVSPRAPGIHAQRVARFHFFNIRRPPRPTLLPYTTLTVAEVDAVFETVTGLSGAGSQGRR